MESTKRVFEESMDVRCMVCLGTLRSPRMLPCLHTMCEVCIDGLIAANKRDGYKSSDACTITCPTCRSEWANTSGGAGALPLNPCALESIRARKKGGSAHWQCEGPCNGSIAVVHCNTCKTSLCEDCSRVHSSFKMLASHDLVTIAEHAAQPSPSQSMCKEHPLLHRTYYCNTCRQHICTECLAHKHRSHASDVVIVDKAAAAELLSRAKSIEEQLHGAMQSVREVYSTLSSSAEEAEQAIHASFNALVDMVRAREREVVVELKKLVEDKHKQLEAQEDSLECGASRLRAVAKMGAAAMAMSEPVEMALLLNQVKKAFDMVMEVEWTMEAVSTGMVGYSDAGLEQAREALKMMGKISDGDVNAGDVTMDVAEAQGEPFYIRNITLRVGNGKQQTRVQGLEVRVHRPYGESDNITMTAMQDERGRLHGRVDCSGEEGEHVVEATVRGVHVGGSPWKYLYRNKRWGVDMNPHKINYEGRTIHRVSYDGNYYGSVSMEPCSDITFRVIGGAQYRGDLLVGFIARREFVDGYGNFINAHAYCLFLYNGSVYSARTHKAYYNQDNRIPSGSVIRCLHDRSKRTISFIINGVEAGIAFTDVPDMDLHFMAETVNEGDGVEIIV